MNVFNCYMVDRYSNVKIVLARSVSKTTAEKIKAQSNKVIDHDLSFVYYQVSKDPYSKERISIWK